VRTILRCTILVVTVSLGATVSGQAQTAPADPDVSLNLAQPDFTLIGLPTTLRLPVHKGAFRVTHRFTRPLGNGSFGDLASDFFSLDSGAQIGLEYRFGLMRGTQVGFHRTSERTVEFFAQHEVKAQSGSFPLTISALASIDGTNNFRDSHTPALGVVVSRTIGDRAAFYIEPVWVDNSNLLPSQLVDHNDSVLLGLGARLRVRPTVYLALEGTPRVAGDKPSVAQLGFGLEKRAGGHTFQLNFSNGFGTTLGQIARGGTGRHDWYLGFNISRKFF
jgi:Membrane bound beta barrel domain (DUF5777)